MSHKSAPFAAVGTIGIDLGKNSFHLVVLARTGRTEMSAFTAAFGGITDMPRTLRGGRI
jgi:exopolyphosphatase/pppGpp-phosphohydrolase